MTDDVRTTAEAAFEDLRNRTLGLFLDLVKTAGRRESPGVAARLSAAEGRLRDAALTVAVCGEFKRGKSSLLNALLEEEPGLFPVNAAVATSVVTTVSYGEQEQIAVTLADPAGKLQMREIPRAEIVEYATEGAGDEDRPLASLVTVETPNPRLRSGLVLVDTPGVGGVFAGHTAATTGFLPSADVIVFVCDFSQPLMSSELRFLRQATTAADLLGDPDGLLVVVTKSDLVTADEREKLLSNTIGKLTEVLGRPPEEITVIPVSSRLKRAWLNTGDPAKLAESNFAALDAALWPAIARRRARVVLGSALTEAAAGVTALLEPLRAERASLEADVTETKRKLADDGKRRRAELEKLHTSRPEWRAELRRSVSAIGRTLRLELDSRLDAVWHRFDSEYLEDPTYLAEPELLVAALTADATIVAGSVSELAQREAAELQRSFAREHGLQLELPGLAALPAPRVPPIEVHGTAHGAPKSDRMFDKVRAAVLGGGVGKVVGGAGGVTVGALLGTLLAPGLGTVLGGQLGGVLGGLAGGLTGLFKGMKSAGDRHRNVDLNARRRSIATEMAPLRRSQPRDLRAALDALLDGLLDAVLAELDSRITAARETADDAVSRLSAAAESSGADAAARLRTLAGECAPLEAALRSIDDLAARARDLGGKAFSVEDNADRTTDDNSWADE